MVNVERKETAWKMAHQLSCAPNLNGVFYVPFIHISLVEAGYMAVLNFKGVRMCSPTFLTLTVG